MKTDIHEFIKLTLRSAFDGSPEAKQLYSEGEEVCNAVEELLKKHKHRKNPYGQGSIALGLIVYLQSISDNFADFLFVSIKNSENVQELMQLQDALDQIKLADD